MNALRKPIVAGNWKMSKTVAEALALVHDIKLDISACKGVEVVVCPPFTALQAVGAAISGTDIGLGAQNMHWESNGAYTGEISANMLRSIYCHYVILGHSERRSYFGETDEIVNKKTKAALASHLIPIVCIGETLEERQSEKHKTVVKTQLEGSLAGISAEDIKRIVVAYEPVWAIGTGEVASPEQAQDMHAFIRLVLAEIANAEIASGVRIQYGGSMKPSNAAELLSQPDIDGGLIGGAALDARSFVELIRIAQSE